MRLFRYGVRASFCTRSKTGPIRKKVRKSERPTMIWFDGALGVPSAVRTKPSTITMRVKLVISSTIDGATESSVITMTICTATLTCPPAWPEPSRPMFKRNGSPAFAAAAVGWATGGLAGDWAGASGAITVAPETPACPRNAGTAAHNETVMTPTDKNRRKSAFIGTTPGSTANRAASAGQCGPGRLPTGASCPHTRPRRGTGGCPANGSRRW